MRAALRPGRTEGGTGSPFGHAGDDGEPCRGVGFADGARWVHRVGADQGELVRRGAGNDLDQDIIPGAHDIELAVADGVLGTVDQDQVAPAQARFHAVAGDVDDCQLVGGQALLRRIIEGAGAQVVEVAYRTRMNTEMARMNTTAPADAGAAA